MSFEQENLAAFMELLETQPTLFSPENIAELEQLISPLPDDIETLSMTVASWCQQHPIILNGQMSILKEYSLKQNTPPPAPKNSNRKKPLNNGKPYKTEPEGFRESFKSHNRGVGSQKPNVPKYKYKLDKKALLNAIQQSSFTANDNINKSSNS